MRPTIVVYEDRAPAFIGAQLLIRSILRIMPESEIFVYGPPEILEAGLEGLSKVKKRPTTALLGRKWNVKPSVLLSALNEREEVLWLDSDIVLTGDLLSVLSAAPSETLVVGQEFRVDGHVGGELRAAGHGLRAVRVLPYHVNSGSVRVSRHHIPLLTAWDDLLEGADYQSAQSMPVKDRPPEYVGDQDVLWALLVSERFADIVVHFLRNGTDMIQHCGANGYHVLERMAVLRGSRPKFVHMLGPYKPWSFADIPPFLLEPAAYMHLVAYELSPMFEASSAYSSQLSNPEWLRRRTIPARVLHTLFLGNVALQGMPLSIGAWLASLVRRR